jgi:trimeric autotransporter adhesin
MKKNLCFFLFALYMAILVANARGQMISTYAGNGITGYTDSGGVRTNAEFNHPWGLAFDGAGNLYIADHVNSAIRKITPSGIISTYAGTTTTGYMGDGGPATDAFLERPASIAFDAGGNLYIADNMNHVIRKIDASGYISTKAGTGTQGYTGDGGPATAATFNIPSGIALDHIGNIYVADSGNNVIRKIDTSGIVTTFAGTGTGSYTGDGGPAASATFFGPVGLAIDAGGNIYVADHINNVVRKINTSMIVSTFAGTGTAGYSGDEGPATAAQLNQPNSITFDPGGNVLISDEFNNRIRRVAADGTITTIVGIGSVGYAGDGGPATAASLFRPMGIVFDAAGKLYISDYINSVIRVVDMSKVYTNAPRTPGANDLLVFPDPAKDLLQIQISAPPGLYKLEIEDMTGRQLFSLTTRAEKIQADISSLASGCYQVICYSSGQRMKPVKFLKY